MDFGSQLTLDMIVLFYLGVLFGLGLFLAIKGMKDYHLYQKIKNTPTTNARAAAAGLVELYGSPKTSVNLRAPISGEKCLYWKVAAFHSTPWSKAAINPVFTLESRKQFTLHDATGYVLVDASGSEMSGLEKIDFYEPPLKGPLTDDTKGPKLKKFIDGLESGQKSAILAHKNDIVKVTEYRLPISDKLYVLGNAEPQEDGSLVVRKKDIMYTSQSSERDIRGSAVIMAFFELAVGLLMLFPLPLYLASLSY